MIPAMDRIEGRPVSVLTQRYLLCLFDDSVETCSSQRRQPWAREMGPAEQQKEAGPPRAAGDTETGTGGGV